MHALISIKPFAVLLRIRLKNWRKRLNPDRLDRPGRNGKTGPVAAITAKAWAEAVVVWVAVEAWAEAGVEVWAGEKAKGKRIRGNIDS
jgi:hypothetical protein